MNRQRVIVLSLEHPASMVLKEVQSHIVHENHGVYNCISADPGGKWSEEATNVTRHWLTKSEEVWFYRMTKDAGLMFFRDIQGRIINVKEMLIELKLAKKFSFMYQSREQTQIKKLKSEWVDLHDLKIDFNQFKEIQCKKVERCDPLPGPPEHKEVNAVEIPVQSSISSLEAAAAFLEALESGQSPTPVKLVDQSSPKEPSPQLDSTYKYYPGKDTIFVYAREHPEQYKSLDDVPFPDDLKKSIPKDNLTMHMHIWPRIETGGSAIIIESPLERKFIFEPVVFNYVFSKINSTRGQSGPLSVVIVDTRLVADNVLNYFNLLNEGFTKQVRFKAFLDSHDMDAELVEKELRCDVLILTLPMMISLLRKRIDGFELSSADMVVFKNVHNMGAQELQEAFVYFRPLHKKRVIVTSRFWRPAFKKLYTDMHQPIICFGSPVEVALKENTEIVIKLAKDEGEQLSHLTDIVNQSLESNCRTGIVCLTLEAMELVRKKLETNGTEVYSLGETPNNSNIMVMLDKHIKNMNVGTVDVLVHFSVAKWNHFSKRFVLFEEHLLNQSPTKTFVLLDVNDYGTFLNEMQTLVARTSVKGTDALVEMFCQVKESAELLPANKSGNLCENLPFYGECPDTFSCKNRHTLNETDIPDGRRPIRGQVELKIISVVSPNHFMAEIIPTKIVRDKIQREMMEMKLEMLTYFSDQTNRVPKTQLVVGDFCVIHVVQYRRARICHFGQAGKSSKFMQINVQCLETGNRFTMRDGLDEIYELPQQFCKQLPQVVDVYLLGVVPIEVKSGWCAASLNKLKHSLKLADGERFTVKGNVAFALGNQIYLKTFKIFENLACGVPIVNHDVVEWLLSYKLATYNNKGLERMQQMIEEFDLYSKIVVPMEEEVEIEQAEKETEREVETVEETAEVEKPETVSQDSDASNSQSLEKLANADNELVEDFDCVEEIPNEEENEEIWEDDNAETFEYVSPNDFGDFDDNFDGDELELARMWMEMQMFNIPSTVSKNYPSATIEEITDGDEKEQGDEEENSSGKVAMLKASLNFPEIYWSQSEDEIKLRVAAQDFEDYNLELDTDSLKLCLLFTGGFLRGGVMHFFGEIDPDASSVEVRGLYIVVTLVKVLPGVQFQWPRLLETKQVVRWLKFYQNFAEVDKEDLKMDLCEIFVPDVENDYNSTMSEKVDMTYLS